MIVLDGLDKTGKTTNAEALYKLYYPIALLVKLPDRTTEIGKMIDDFLKNKGKQTEHTMRLLFAANASERQQDIKTALLEGKLVIVDRYVYSNVAYGNSRSSNIAYGSGRKFKASWLYSLYEGFVMPDATFHLEINEHAALERGQFAGAERYEKKEIQDPVKRNFEKISLLGDWPHIWKDIDSSDSKENVLAQLVTETKAVIDRCKHEPIKYIQSDDYDFDGFDDATGHVLCDGDGCKK